MKKITFLLFIAVFWFAIGQSQQTLESVLNLGTVNLDLSQRAIAGVTSNPLTKGVSQTFTSRVDFNTACGSALTLENFAGGPGVILGCGPIISSAGEACFLPGEIQPGIQVTMNGGDNTVYIPSGSFGNANPMVGANTFVNFTILNFPDNNVNSVGLDLIALTAGGTIQVRVFGTGGLIDSYNVTSPVSTVFFGVIATETIVSIQLEDLTLVNAELVGMVEYGTCGGGGGGCTPSDITTFFTGGNSFAGNMFDVTASGADDLLIDGFDVNVTAGSGTISVYTRPGSYVGFEGSAAGWTLMGSEVVTGAGSNLPTPVNVGGLTIPAGQTYGFYVTVSDYPSLTMNYTNGDNVFSDANITIATGVGKGDPDFTGSTFASRSWNGTIYYCSGTGGG
ncbi:MAG: hypothetical protein CVU03_14140, partial [Bacteroidetes bacterium HGW-Bacteroidetes-2]